MKSALKVACISVLALASVPSAADSLDRQAERFVTLALSLGNVHPPEIDGYFGPARLDVRTSAAGPTLPSIRLEAQKLRTDIAALVDVSTRKTKLQSQVDALNGVLEVVGNPKALAFEAEALAIYGMTLPPPQNAGFSRAQQALEKLLPGPGALASRVLAFRNQFVVPADKRKAVFERALNECRARTLAKWRLPSTEHLGIEWTHDVDAAWHRYEGNYRSTLRLNPAAVAYLSSAIDVACHEGYPGHHAQFVVMEARVGTGKLAVEDTVVLLRSPVSMLREGAANYGVTLAFPPAERLAFERDTLFPLAGFDPTLAKKYAEVNRLADELSSNVAAIVRDYRDKRLSADAASRALENRALVASPAALLRFVDQLGPYVLGYTAARDKVAQYVEAKPADPWGTLRDVLEYSKVALLR